MASQMSSIAELAGSSLTAKLVLFGDAAASLAVAIVEAWHSEVWRAANNRPGPNLGLLQLRRIWDAIGVPKT